jgi:hypothetical protein
LVDFLHFLSCFRHWKRWITFTLFTEFTATLKATIFSSERTAKSSWQILVMLYN